MLLLVPCLSTHINLPVFKKCPSFRMRSCCVVHATDQLMRRLCIVQLVRVTDLQIWGIGTKDVNRLQYDFLLVRYLK